MKRVMLQVYVTDRKLAVSRYVEAFEILQENATIHSLLGDTDYAKLMVDFTDQFGVRWCSFG